MKDAQQIKSNIKIFVSCFIVLNETDNIVPIATLSYANGPGFVNNIDESGTRKNLAEVEFRKLIELNLEIRIKEVLFPTFFFFFLQIKTFYTPLLLMLSLSRMVEMMLAFLHLVCLFQ